MLLALVAFLVPVFEKIFKDFGGELPAITKFTVWLSHLITGRWYVIIAVVAALVLRLPEVEVAPRRGGSSGTRSSSSSR